MKKSFVVKSCLVLFGALAFMSCNDKKNEKPRETLVLTMAEVNPEDSTCGKLDAAFKSKLEEISQGSVVVDLKCSGILGDETQVMNLMLSPDSPIQLARVSASLASYGGKKSRLITIPYTFSNADHFWKFASSDIAQDILNEPYEMGLGVKGLCYAEEGFRHFFSTTKINSMEDLDGKKIRVSGKVLTDLATSLKGEPVKVAFTDLYMSLQTGLVDVADQPLTNYLTNSFYEVAPYIILDKHMLGAVQILISSTTWDSLTDEQKKWFKEASTYASNYCKQIREQQEETIITTLKEKDVTLVDVDDLSSWQTACKDMIQESSQEFPDLYKSILNLK